MAVAVTLVRDDVRMLRALGDETRLEIVERLLGGEQCVCDLVAALGVAQSRLSFHLKALKEAGLVSDRREGRWVYYALDRAALRGLSHRIGALARQVSSRRRLCP